MPVVSSGEATSYNSDSKQTIPGPGRASSRDRRGRRIGGLFFSATSLSFVVHFSRTWFLGDVIFAATVPTSSLVAMFC
jgi:hypothetical protein